MKTDLARILSVAGRHGLFEYVAQARNGAIAESLETKKRTVFTGSSRVNTLNDIAIFTSEGELKLDAVFTAIKNALGDAEAPSPKASEKELVDLFRRPSRTTTRTASMSRICARSSTGTRRLPSSPLSTSSPTRSVKPRQRRKLRNSEDLKGHNARLFEEYS